MANQKGLVVTTAVGSPPQRSAPRGCVTVIPEAVGALEQVTPSDPMPIMSYGDHTQ